MNRNELSYQLRIRRSRAPQQSGLVSYENSRRCRRSLTCLPGPCRQPSSKEQSDSLDRVPYSCLSTCGGDLRLCSFPFALSSTITHHLIACKFHPHSSCRITNRLRLRHEASYLTTLQAPPLSLTDFTSALWIRIQERPLFFNVDSAFALNFSPSDDTLFSLLGQSCLASRCSP